VPVIARVPLAWQVSVAIGGKALGLTHCQRGPSAPLGGADSLCVLALPELTAAEETSATAATSACLPATTVLLPLPPPRLYLPPPLPHPFPRRPCLPPLQALPAVLQIFTTSDPPPTALPSPTTASSSRRRYLPSLLMLHRAAVATPAGVPNHRRFPAAAASIHCRHSPSAAPPSAAFPQRSCIVTMPPCKQ